MEMKFKQGDTVRSKAGGPLMNVNENVLFYPYQGEPSFDGEVLCYWFDGNKKVESKFQQDTLELDS